MTIELTEKFSFDNNNKKKAKVETKQGNDSSKYYKCFQNYYHGHNYLKPNPQYIGDVGTSYSHWQLRDLLDVDQSKGKLYFRRDDSVREISRSRDGEIRSRKTADTDFAPKCFSVGLGKAVVYGGVMSSSAKAHSSGIESLGSSDRSGKGYSAKNGLYGFYSMETGERKTAQLGDAINNAVTVYAHGNGQYKSYVCNNDFNLYEVFVGGGDRIALNSQIMCEPNTSLNNVCRSPTNDKLLTVTGDTGSIHLVDTLVGLKIGAIKTSHDSGFGISYHPNGSILSTVFQDGTCCLHDIRNYETPLAEIKSTRPGHQPGAFRCCKFADSSINDLLAILEHAGRVHLFDLRNLNGTSTKNHQVIVFPHALDQFGEYMKPCKRNTSLSSIMEGGEDFDESTHYVTNIYGDSASPKKTQLEDEEKQNSCMLFTAPLVYDYDYLTNVNPKLFKNYAYQPPSCSEYEQQDYFPLPEFNYPQWNNEENACNQDSSPFSYNRRSSVGPYMLDDYNSIRRRSSVMSAVSMNSRASRGSIMHSRASTSSYDYYSDLYLTSNNINGEIELVGINWLDNNLLFAGQNAGILKWEVNTLGRRSFGSYSYV